MVVNQNHLESVFSRKRYSEQAHDPQETKLLQETERNRFALLRMLHTRNQVAKKEQLELPEWT